MCGFYVELGHLFVSDFDSGFVFAIINGSFHYESFAGTRGSYEVDDHLNAHQWFATPVLGNETEQTMFYLVPFAGARREKW
jgi:hypothetical protein